MRVDKFLKTAQLIKRRTVANEAADEGFIKVNGKVVKPSYILKVNDIIEIDMWNYYKKIEKYIKVLEYKTKEIDM